MNFKQIVQNRESCRAYSEKPVLLEDIKDILNCAIQSPSACNSQPWKFIVCEGETAKQMPNCIINESSPINRWVGEAFAYIVVCEMPALLMNGEISQKYAQTDVGIACATICYAAADKGIGTCILGLFNEENTRQLLNIPQDIKISYIITLGYPKNENARPKRRKNIDDVISFNKW